MLEQGKSEKYFGFFVDLESGKSIEQSNLDGLEVVSQNSQSNSSKSDSQDGVFQDTEIQFEESEFDEKNQNKSEEELRLSDNSEVENSSAFQKYPLITFLLNTLKWFGVISSQDSFDQGSQSSSQASSEDIEKQNSSSSETLNKSTISRASSQQLIATSLQSGRSF